MNNEMVNNKNIYELIRQRAFENPDKILISVDQEEVTNHEFIKNVDRIASALHHLGAISNQKIGIIIPNSILWYEIFWAVVKLGAHPVPLDPQVGEWEMSRLITLADIQICFAASQYRSNTIFKNLLKIRNEVPFLKRIISVDQSNEQLKEQLNGQSHEQLMRQSQETSILNFEQFVELSDKKGIYDDIYIPTESDALMLACTSGSTGNPKIIVVPHLGFCKSQDNMSDYLGLNQNDIMLLGMPLYHQGGFGMGLQMILKGGTVLYQPTFDPIKFLTTIEEKKVTAIQLTATLAKILLSVPDFEKYDISSVKVCYFAGEVLPMEVAREFFEKLSIRVINVIGSSETATMVVWDSDFDREVDVNEFRRLPFTDFKLLDEEGNEVSEGTTGTIFIHTDALIYEYYKNENETNLRIVWIDGKKWFNTGDLAVKRPNGRIQFAGRIKRVIKRGSNLVYPEEVEAFLLTHPDIEAIAIVGKRHEIIGEMIIAHIQPKEGVNLTRGDIIKFSRGKLAAYKIPDEVILTDEIPNDIGKVQYKYLKS